MQEAKTTPYRSWFITLTYSDETLPKTITGDATLRKKDLQDFLKRTRKNTPLRYFAVGEYGDLSFRPHYHLAVFPATNAPYLEYAEKWEKGHTLVTELQPERCAYLARYTIKKFNKAQIECTDQNIEPEWSIQSRKPALGYQMAKDISGYYQTRTGAELLATRGDIDQTIRMEGKNYPIGSYGVKIIREELGLGENFAERKIANPLLEKYFPLHRPFISDGETHRHQQARLKRGQTKKRRNETIRI